MAKAAIKRTPEEWARLIADGKITEKVVRATVRKVIKEEFAKLALPDGSPSYKSVLLARMIKAGSSDI